MILTSKFQLLYLFLSLFFNFVRLDSSAQVKKLEEELNLERLMRHVEIRRELEKEATPFLENALKFEIPKLSVPSFLSAIAPSQLDKKTVSWIEYFSAFSFIDLTMGIFSLVSLAFGSAYLAWRFNPFKSKIEK